MDRLPERFRAKVRIDGECWCWQGALTNNGYPRYKDKGKTVMAHRYAYEVLVGPIPEDRQLDHLCRVRHCVRPDHLEAVTPQINVLRGNTVVAANHRKTHCHKGHQLSGDNLFIRRDGRRRCRTCEKATQLRIRRTPAYLAGHARRQREYTARKRQEKEL